MATVLDDRPDLEDPLEAILAVDAEPTPPVTERLSRRARDVDATGADVEPVHEEAKAGDARHTHADVSKAGDLLGYEPTVDIRPGVEKFVEWYRANEDWYRPLAAE